MEVRYSVEFYVNDDEVCVSTHEGDLMYASTHKDADPVIKHIVLELLESQRAQVGELYNDIVNISK